MLEKADDVVDIAKKAYRDVGDFLKKAAMTPQALLARRAGVRGVRAAIFAEEIIGAPVVLFDCLPKPGYASWLFGPTPQIAIDMSQIHQWCARGAGTNDPSQRIEACHADVQEVRVILHEAGHCRLQGEYLLSKERIGPDGYAAPATAEEEEEAWVYAGIALALVLGDYAFTSREATDQDETPSIPI